VLLFHKIDQYNEKERKEMLALAELYRSIGYRCIFSSLVTGEGLDEMKSLIENKITLISGHSATGKSSLVNHFIPGKDLRIGEVSESSNKGQHTTTFAEMHQLPFGGFLVDTPGIKGFGLVDIPKEELHHHFLEFFELLPECKYHNCLHLNEPGCAVRKALEAGEVAPSRYNSYVSMYGDEEERSVYRNGSLPCIHHSKTLCRNQFPPTKAADSDAQQRVIAPAFDKLYPVFTNALLYSWRISHRGVSAKPRLRLYPLNLGG